MTSKSGKPSATARSGANARRRAERSSEQGGGASTSASTGVTGPSEPRRTTASQQAGRGDYVWRGGRKIELEKAQDRFTIMPTSQEQVARVRSAPGVRDVQPVTNQVYKVETTATELDGTMDAVRSSAFNTIAHHAYRPKGSDGTIFYISDTIMVVFDPDATSAQIEKVLGKYKLKVLKQYEGRAHACLVQVTSSSGENPIKVANRLAAEKIILSAEPNMINRFQPAFIPSDPYFPRQWHLNAKDGPQLLAQASVDATSAWDATRGERSIVVAVIDDGFDLGHPDFQGQGKVVSPRDYVDGDANPFPETSKGDYHGTACAGVAIAEMNGRGVVGVAGGCAFMPVRFPLAADDDLLMQIFEEVGQQADVISCSWGPPPVFSPLSTLVADTISQLVSSGGRRGKGCVICFAAANFNAPINDPGNSGGFVWLDYGTGMLRRTVGPILNGFAAHPGIIAVAASTSLNTHAAYSNWGAEVSVCSPSDNWHPLDRQQFVPGRGIWTTDNEAFGKGFTPHSRYTGNFGGTSSATPLAAGIAALCLSANPDLMAAEVRDILENTADKIIDSNADVISGANRGQYSAKGRCDWFGFGKVNAAKAVEEAAHRHA
jgi:subtilisin family serine protease